MRHLHPEIRAALLAALFAVLALWLGARAAWPLSVDLGNGRDARFVRGFHEPEPFGTAQARWSTGESAVALPAPPPDGPAILSINLINARPAGLPPPQVTLNYAGQPLAQITPQGARVYRILAPPTLIAGRDAVITIGSDAVSTPTDPRALGVAVDRIGLAPLGTVRLPSLWLLGCALLLGTFGYALLRLLGANSVLAVGGSAALAAVLAIGCVLRPTEVLPFVQRIPMLLGVAVLGVGVGRVLADQRSLVLGLSFITLLLALFWWLGPLVQLLLTADGATGVTPPVATLWIGAGLLIALLVCVLVSRTRPVETRNTWLTTAALSVCALAALVHLGSTLQFAFTRSGPDFWILFKGAREWARGGPLYDLTAVSENHFGHVFKVPPFYGTLFLPFVFRDGLEILFYHRLLNVLLLAATVLAWFRMFRLPVASAVGLGTLILLSFRPFADTIAYGQIDLALLLCLTLALWALREGRDGWAGALVALGTLFKVYPILLLAFFVVKRQWWALAGFALTMLALNGFSLAVMGWEPHRMYLFDVLPKIGGTTPWVENQTLSGFLARFFDSPGNAAILPVPVIAQLGLLLGGCIGLLGCILALPPTERRGTAFALQYGQFLLLMVLVVPAAWMHYQTLLFVPFAALLLHYREQPPTFGRAVALAAAFALIAYGNQWSYYDGTVMGVLTVAAVSFKLYGMLLLGGVLVAELAPAALHLLRNPRQALAVWWRPHIAKG